MPAAQRGPSALHPSIERRPILAFVRRGILGGTFDPPHIAHLLAAEAAFRELALDIVTFIPAGAPWQKSDRVLAPAGDRWEMTRLAVEPIDYFEADDREVRRRGWTYTVDTLAEFGEDEVVLILGSDAAAGLSTWHRFAEVLQMAQLAVAPRPGTSLEDVEDALSVGFHKLSGPELNLSGELLRARVAEGRSIRFLVPDAVGAYIESRGLYGQRRQAASH